MKVKEESEKIVLKLNIQKTKIMASGPVTSWEIDGETVETVSDFIFLGSKITICSDFGALDNSKFPPCQEKDYSHPKNSPARFLKSCRI